MKCEHCEIVNDDTGGIAYCKCNGDIPDHWRDVREELPEIGEAVLTCNMNGICQDERDLFIGYINESDKKWYRPWTDQELTPTHWQPLPQAPEAQS